MERQNLPLKHRKGPSHQEGMYARRAAGAPGIQINVPATDPNALPPAYRACGALFTITKAQVSHA